jgi:hypothetical protein
VAAAKCVVQSNSSSGCTCQAGLAHRTEGAVGTDDNGARAWPA